MRTLVQLAVLLGSLIAMSVPASAEHLSIVEDKLVFVDAYYAQLIDQPWSSQRPRPRLVERPFADLLETKLGIAQGKAQLFRLQIENAPSSGTMLKGSVDGIGIKLKLTW